MFAKAVEIGLPNLRTLRLHFDNDSPQPAIKNWDSFAKLMSKGLPNLNRLYIINEIPRTTKYKPEIQLLCKHESSYSSAGWDTHIEWDSLEVLHIPWQIMKGFQSIPESLPQNLRELIVDVKDYVDGPLAKERCMMLSCLRSAYAMYTYMSHLTLIAYTGWVLDYRPDEEDWRAGMTSKEQYHQQVVWELIQWNNARPYGGIGLPRLLHDWTLHDTDLRIFYENGYELCGAFIKGVGTYIIGGFPDRLLKSAGQESGAQIIEGQESEGQKEIGGKVKIDERKTEGQKEGEEQTGGSEDQKRAAHRGNAPTPATVPRNVGQKREIGRRGIIYGQKEHPYTEGYQCGAGYPDGFDWKHFRKPRGFHDKAGWYKGKWYGVGKEPEGWKESQPPPSPPPEKQGGWWEWLFGP
ncbi:hypothetical protein FKW77_000937 [Venturia effusa]|uniref:Uncharacterized protein n=1 Tax=Venturia effusa TaxID=50376 RepID=A0A517L8K0_9PEZI|nr:hypothetical protein FKW77_000937 [Venturia effusa]